MFENILMLISIALALDQCYKTFYNVMKTIQNKDPDSFISSIDTSEFCDNMARSCAYTFRQLGT